MKIATLNSRKRHAGPKPKPEPLRLDFGCGSHKREGFKGVDGIKFPGVDFVLNMVEPIYVELPKEYAALADCFERKIIGYKKWPWKNDSVEEAHCLPEGSMVNTPEGRRPIETILQGDLVLGFSGPTRVVRPLSRRYSGLIYAIKSGTCFMEVTADHPIATPLGWLKANKLRKSGHVLRIPSEVEFSNGIDCGNVFESVMCLSSFSSDCSVPIVVSDSSDAKFSHDPRLGALSSEEWKAHVDQGKHRLSSALDNKNLSNLSGGVAAILIDAQMKRYHVPTKDLSAPFDDTLIAIRNCDLRLELGPVGDVNSDISLTVDNSGKVSKVCVGHIDDISSYHYIGKVFNLVTEDSTFFVNDILTHNCSHCVEHFKQKERIHFFNELYRVLKPGGKCTVITPHWASCRAYGDLTHEWPAVSDFFWFYLGREWRMANAPHDDAEWWAAGYTCDFKAGSVTWGYSLEPGVAARNQEYQQFALQYYKESAQDTIATLTKL